MLKHKVTKKFTPRITDKQDIKENFMMFLEPTSDLVFKKLFDIPDNKDLLIDFLNNILELTDANKNLIESIELNDPIIHQLSTKIKGGVFDVMCTDQGGNKYIVEMQASKEENFIERVQLYVATAISLQLAPGDKRNKLVPVVLVSVVNWNLFEDHKRCISGYKLLDTCDHICRLPHIRMHFVELKKFKKSDNELSNNVDRWLYFLSKASTCHEIPHGMQDTIFEKAFAVINRAGWSQDDLLAYFLEMDKKASRESQLDAAKKDGRDERSLEVARAMLAKKMSLKDISEVTGLSEKILALVGLR